jgi:hypothetical protein
MTRGAFILFRAAKRRAVELGLIAQETYESVVAAAEREMELAEERHLKGIEAAKAILLGLRRPGQAGQKTSSAPGACLSSCACPQEKPAPHRSADLKARHGMMDLGGGGGDA